MRLKNRWQDIKEPQLFWLCFRGVRLGRDNRCLRLMFLSVLSPPSPRFLPHFNSLLNYLHGFKLFHTEDAFFDLLIFSRPTRPCPSVLLGFGSKINSQTSILALNRLVFSSKLSIQDELVPCTQCRARFHCGSLTWT